MPKKRNPGGCKCCGVPVTFVVNGCAGIGIAGATVSIAGVSGTTGDGTGGTTLGQVVLFVPTGTNTLTVTPPGGFGFGVYTSSVTYTTMTTTIIALAGDSAHACVSCCNYPIPKTLYISDGNGTHALTWSGGGWSLLDIDTGIVGYDISTDGCGNPYCCSAGANALYGYSLEPCGYPGGNTWRLSVGWGAVCCSGPTGPCGCTGDGAGWNYASAPANAGDGAQGVSTSVTCFPFSGTFDVPSTGNGSIECLGTLATPGGGGTLVVTP